MKTKVLIHVKGGIVQWIASNNEDVKIVIVDEDRQGNDENFLVSSAVSPDRIEEDMYKLYNDATDNIEVEVRDELKRMKF